MFKRDSAHSHALLEALFSVREEKAVELQFTVGEALSCVAAGPLSTALRSPWDLTHTAPQSVCYLRMCTHTSTNQTCVPEAMIAVCDSSSWLHCTVPHTLLKNSILQWCFLRVLNNCCTYVILGLFSLVIFTITY